tara:strand:+ start:222 stop:1730 length:1509 start_codon:yes stop_codon:yes gene_type:complete
MSNVPNEGVAKSSMSRPDELAGEPIKSIQIGPLTRMAYGTGGIAGGVISAGLSMFVLLYYSRVLGVSAGLVGTALAIALCFDALSDPLVGYASDKFRSRWGRRHPFMYFAILPVSLLVYLLWNPPLELLDSQGLFIYLLCVVVSLRLLLTTFEVPSTALNPELSNDYDERTQLANYRVCAGWAASTMLALLLYGYWLRDTPEYPDGLLNVAGYEQLGLASAIIVLVAMLVCSIGLHSRIPSFKQPAEKHYWTVRGTLRGLMRAYSEPTLVPLLTASVLVAIAFSTSGALQIYTFSYFWELNSAEISGLMMAWGVGVVLGFVVTPLVSRGRDKRRVVFVMLAVLALEEICFPGLRIVGLFPPTDSALYYPLIFLLTTVQMAFYLAVVAMLASMIADVAEIRELASGEREEGTIYSAQMLIGKTGSALGVWIAGFVLELVAFPTAVEAIAVATETAHNLVLGLIVVCLAIYPIALVCIWRIRVSRATHRLNLEQLQLRDPVSGY